MLRVVTQTLGKIGDVSEPKVTVAVGTCNNDNDALRRRSARRPEVFAQDAIVGLSMTGASANSIGLTMVG